MKSGAPWSVKGIDPEARSTAKEAARRSGMTLGQWLNNVIADAADDETADDYTPRPDPADQDVAELHRSLGDMSERLERSDETLQEVTERLSRFETFEPVEGESLDALSSLQASQERLLERIENIEQVASQRNQGRGDQRLEASIEKLTAHVEQSSRQSLSSLKTVQKALGHLVGRMEAVEQDKNTSSELIGTALEHITSRLEDKEDNESLLLRAIENLNSRVDQMENRQSDSGTGVREQLKELARSIEAASQSHKTVNPQVLDSALQRIAHLETGLDRLTLKVENARADHEDTLNAIQRRLSEIADSIDRDVDVEVDEIVAEPEAPKPKNTKRQIDDDTDLDAIIEDFHSRAQRGADRKPESLIEKAVRTNEEKAKEETSPVKAVRASLKGNDQAQKKTETPAKEVGEVLPPWLRDAQELDENRPFLRRKVLLSVIAVSFLAMAGAAAFVLRDDLPALEDIIGSENRPGITTIFGDFNSAERVTSKEKVVADDAEQPPAPVAETPQPVTTTADATLSTILPFNDLDLQALQTEAEAGEKHAQYILALRYFVGDGVEQDRSEALEWLEASAESGFAPAQYRAGVAYERGQGTEPDRETARDYYQLAAEQGNAKAMYNLAVLNADGLNDTQDFEAAAVWFERAAQLGLTDAQFNLGIVYSRGIGVDEDPAAAYRWFAIAAANGDAEARDRGIAVAEQLEQSEIEELDKLIAEWQPAPYDPYVNFETGAQPEL